MKAQEGKTEKENRIASLEKKMQHDHDSVENIQNDSNSGASNQDGYGDRSYENDVASNNQNGSQNDQQSQAQTQANYQNNDQSSHRSLKQQGLGEDGKSFGGSSFSNNADASTGEDRNYEDHETINAQFQQTQSGNSYRTNNNLENQNGSSAQHSRGMTSNDVAIGNNLNANQVSASDRQNTRDYSQGYNSNEGMRNLQEQDSPQNQYGGSDYGNNDNSIMDQTAPKSTENPNSNSWSSHRNADSGSPSLN
ncbi:MAG: hypothetical protein WBA16_06990 [Nonlabens sp.]